jgi:hypothetical protein
MICWLEYLAFSSGLFPLPLFHCFWALKGILTEFMLLTTVFNYLFLLCLLYLRMWCLIWGCDGVENCSHRAKTKGCMQLNSWSTKRNNISEDCSTCKISKFYLTNCMYFKLLQIVVLGPFCDTWDGPFPYFWGKPGEPLCREQTALLQLSVTPAVIFSGNGGCITQNYNVFPLWPSTYLSPL